MKQAMSFVRLSVWRLSRMSRGRMSRIALTAGLTLALVLVFGAAMASARLPGPASLAQGHVIVQFGDHDLVGRQIAFEAPISGLRALELSGLEVVTASTAFGTVVCGIGGVGCPADNCFCGGNTFWGYKSWDGSAWQDYMIGAGDSVLDDGAIEGWRWGEWGSAMWPAPRVIAALQGLDWVRQRQSPSDGGYGSDSSSAEALLALGANGNAAQAWRRTPEAPSLAGYWLGRAGHYSSAGAAEAGKLAVGMIATEACWPHTALQPSAYYSETSGAYAVGAGSQAWAILGTVALSQTVPAEAMSYLRGLVRPNGGWEWWPGWGTDTNATALALQALIASGEPAMSEVVSGGLAYLKAAQNPDGGFPYNPDSPWGTDSDANSTAYVVQALVAAGQDPTAPEWSKGTNNPISFLLSLQLPDGSFEWQPGRGSNPLATQQAVVALLGRTFPLRVAPANWCPTLHLPLVSR